MITKVLLGGLGISLIATGFLFWLVMQKTEKIGELNAAVKGYEAAIEYQKQIAEMNSAFNKLLNDSDRIHTQELQDKINERDTDRVQAAQKALDDSFGFSVAFARELSGIMLDISRTSDSEADPLPSS